MTSLMTLNTALPPLSPKDSVEPNDPVLFIDDLLATGGTAKASCQLIESLGAIVETCDL